LFGTIRLLLTFKGDLVPTSIQQLNIYLTARRLEDAAVALAATLPKDQAYPLADDLRRSATAVAHYIYQAHHYFSYAMKIEALHQARSEAEKSQLYLEAIESAGHAQTKELQAEFTIVIKQSWGLIKYCKKRQAERSETETAPTQRQSAAAA
jgi:four helix bundle protein